MKEATETVIIIDDDPSVREALESLLQSVGLEVRLFGSPAAFLAAGPLERPSCLVLDVRLPGQGGLDLQRVLSNAGIRIPIIFITGHGDIPMSVQAMKAGAMEFLTKPFRDQDLLVAIQAGLEADRKRRAEAKSIAELRKHFDTLTQRERDIMALVVTGRLNKQIAATVGLSEITVKVHRSSVMRKMGAKSLAELVLLADRLSRPAE